MKTAEQFYAQLLIDVEEDNENNRYDRGNELGIFN